MRVSHVRRPPSRYDQIARQRRPSSGQFSRHFGGQNGPHTVTEEDERDVEMGCDGSHNAVYEHRDTGDRRLCHPGRPSGQLHRTHIELRRADRQTIGGRRMRLPPHRESKIDEHPENDTVPADTTTFRPRRRVLRDAPNLILILNSKQKSSA